MSTELLNELDINIRNRAKLLLEADKNDGIKKSLLSICKRDLIYFFTYFVYTDRNPSLIPEKFGNAVPFIPYKYQEEFLLDALDAIKMGQLPVEERTAPTDVFSEKSRQLGFSWLFAGLQLYAFMFHNVKSLYISKKAEEVDKNGDIKSHFEKIRFMIRNLPNWMLPKGLEKNSGTDHNKFMNISRSDGTGNIVGESANPNAGRGGTFGFVIFDEMAFMQYAQAINMSISSATPCRFFNSTPNGEGNEYYRMRKLAIEGTVRYHRCMRDEHPLYTEEWYKWKTKSMSKQQIAQELQIDYNTSLEGRVYTEFKCGKEIIEYNDYKPLYVFMDNSHGGSDPHAIVLVQPDGNFINIIESCEFNCSPRQMAEIMAKQPTISMTNRQLEFYEKYNKMRTPVFISDPYDSMSTVGDNTIFGYYQDVGVFLNIPKNRNKAQQIQITKSNIQRIRVSENCSDFNSAIQNARYPERNESSNSTKPSHLPIHDFTSHYRTALEYGIVWLSENEESINKPEEKVITEIRDPVTGQLSYIYT